MSGKLTLVVMSRDGVVLVPILGKRNELFIGRDPECDVCVPGVSVSRRHARLTHDPATGAMQITDLGSRNGTMLDGKRLEALRPVPLAEGSIVRVGDAVLALEQRGGAAMPQRVPWGEAFALRVDAEIARAAAEGTTLALVEIRLDGATGGDGFGSSTTVEGREGLGAALDAERAFARVFRDADVLASFNDGVWRALLPRTSPEQARQLVARLRLLLEELGRKPALRLSTFPRHGGTSEALARALAEVGESGLESSRQQVRPGPMARLKPLIDRVAPSAATVLLVGETGVGKEVLAHAIHDRSPRAGKPLVCINCAAIPENLIESELFGHEKQAFTGALQAKPGLLETAEDGTVLFDEIGEMPMALQSKLLRVLEAREATRVGGLKPRPIHARFIFATHRDLEKEVAAGRFRQDLYFRINTFPIDIPPLRERKDEIGPLAASFIAHACEASGRPDLPRLSPQVLALFETYDWPGNVRELRNVIERAVVLCDGPLITLEHLPLERFRRPRTAIPSTTAEVGPDDAGAGPPAGASPSTAGDAFDAEAPEPPGWPGPNGLDERARIVWALKRCAGNQSAAAKLLNMSRRTFVSRLTKYGLPRPRKLARPAKGAPAPAGAPAPGGAAAGGAAAGEGEGDDDELDDELD
jgi:two-component system, NtrC family, response regulator AtoC